MTVALDGRCLGPTLTGTQLHTIGVVAALDAFTGVQIRMLVPDNLGAWARDFLAARPAIWLLHRSELHRVEPADVVHRPYQVTAPDDIQVLFRLGERIVVSQLDDIALRNPGYFDSYEEWASYRALAQGALGAADQVVFSSRHAAQDALELGLVDHDQVALAPPPTGGNARGLLTDAAPPSGAERLQGRPFLLCLGADFRHKNRIFAYRLLEALIEQGLFDGVLALAGPTAASGSSEGEEAAHLIAHPDVAERVIEFGAVDEAGKRWLLERTAAVLYPTTYEGFGLIPFEAAEAGAPCIFAAHTSLAEILPARAALLVPWDPATSAQKVAPVLTPGQARDELVRMIRLSGARFTSRATAQGLLAAYQKAILAPPRGGGAGVDAKRLKAEVIELRELVAEVYDDPLNRALAGRYAILDPELRRPVLAIANRRPLRNTALALYRVAHALRRGGNRSRSDDGAGG
jgi:hypothetical protein